MEDDGTWPHASTELVAVAVSYRARRIACVESVSDRYELTGRYAEPSHRRFCVDHVLHAKRVRATILPSR